MAGKYVPPHRRTSATAGPPTSQSRGGGEWQSRAGGGGRGGGRRPTDAEPNNSSRGGRRPADAEPSSNSRGGGEFEIEAACSSDEEHADAGSDEDQVGPAERPGQKRRREWDAATAVSELTGGTGTSYLTNAVETLFGHAAARRIGEQLAQATVESGVRLLTHASTGKESREKPHRWMVLRPWSLAEIFRQCPEANGQVPHGEDELPVWHVVIHELKKTAGGKVRVATQYFKHNYDVLFHFIRERFSQFDAIEEDDPGLILTQLRSEDLHKALEVYYHSGDTDSPERHHVLARLALWEDGTLLHRCCEKGFHRCVDALLKGYTEHSAPAGKPWLVVADPLWQEAGWGNSAFHSAAWQGRAEVMRVLWQWAEEHGCALRVKGLRNNAKQDVCQVLERRIASHSELDAADFVETFNVLAEGFGRDKKECKFKAAVRGESVALCFGLDGEKHSLVLPVELSLADLLQQLRAQFAAELSGGEVDTVLIIGVSISEAGEASDAADLLRFLSRARRVALMKCKSAPSVAASLLSAVAGLIQGAGAAPASWRSLDIVPVLLEVPDGGSTSLGLALRELSATFASHCAASSLCAMRLPGMRWSIPAEDTHLPVLLKEVLFIRSFAAHLLEDKDGAAVREFRHSPAQNPLLRGPASVERSLLQKPALMEATHVLQCLPATWGEYVKGYSLALVRHAETLEDWAPVVAGRALTQQGDREALDTLLGMMDQAFLHVLKMRGSRVRPGLPLRPHVKPALSQLAALPPHLFPETRRYAASRGFFE